MEEEQKEKRKKRFTASKIADLLAEGSGKTRMNYIYDLANEAIGIRDELNTKAILHGLSNQKNGYEVAKMIYGLDDLVWYDESIEYGDYLSASPDCLSLDMTADIKCQYTIHNFINQNETLVKKYYLQVQLQMLCAGVDKGLLINYLSRPELFGHEWSEYPFPIEERIFKHDIERNDEICRKIVDAAEKYHPCIDITINKLNSAIPTSEQIFFYLQFKEKLRFQELKEINFLETTREIIRVEDKFYVEKKSK